VSGDRREAPERRKLPYSFTPTPRWVRRDRREGLLTEETYDLISELYDRADTDALIDGAESPTLTLDSIKSAIGYRGDLASLARSLRRLKEAGRYFTFRTVGNSRSAFSYVFQLFSVDPGLSDPCPPVIPHDDRAAGDPAEEPRPPVVEACPPVGDPETGMVEPLPQVAGESAVRPLQTFPEEPNPSGYEELWTGSLREDPARETVVPAETETGDVGEEPSSDSVIAALEAVNGHAAVTNRKPTLADLAAEARDAQRARDLASLSSLPQHERDLIADLLVSLDGLLVNEETG
jgi:hypothetical protein